MCWQSLVLGGACAVAPLAILGCTLVAPLGGLAGDEPDARETYVGSDATTGEAAPGVDSGTVADTGPADTFAPDGGAPGADTGAPPGDTGAADTTADLVDSSSVDAPADVAAEASPPPPIAFVQIAASSPAGSVASITAKLAQAQTAGDLDVVAIGWNDTTSTVSQVTDTAGNTYALAVGPTRLGSDLSQCIYYAKDIHASAAGANSVTVTFVEAANVADLRVVEYGGLDTAAPLDQVATGTGNSAGPAASAAATTTVARELLFAAGMSTDLYSASGTGFTMRLVTSDGDLVEDRTVSATGSYSATASLGASCEWLMQLATFR